jgi:hypothetical protein
MVTYSVMTDLDPNALTEVVMETYRRWLSFALGQSEIGGNVLAHPSGRYAASISWKRTGQSEIAIIADESKAPEGDWIERGRSAFSIKAAMLGKGNTKISKQGYRYRFIPLRAFPTKPTFDMNRIISNSRGERLPVRSAKLWAKARTDVGSNRGATMSDKPGSRTWIIPPMPAYSPAKILADMLRENYGSGR